MENGDFIQSGIRSRLFNFHVVTIFMKKSFITYPKYYMYITV